MGADSRSRQVPRATASDLEGFCRALSHPTPDPDDLHLLRRGLLCLKDLGRETPESQTPELSHWVQTLDEVQGIGFFLILECTGPSPQSLNIQLDDQGAILSGTWQSMDPQQSQAFMAFKVESSHQGIFLGMWDGQAKRRVQVTKAGTDPNLLVAAQRSQAKPWIQPGGKASGLGALLSSLGKQSSEDASSLSSTPEKVAETTTAWRPEEIPETRPLVSPDQTTPFVIPGPEEGPGRLGETIPFTLPAETQLLATPPRETCQRCGAKLGPTDRFCSQCGAPTGQSNTRRP